MAKPKKKTIEYISAPKSVDFESSGSSSRSCANASFVPEQRFSERSTAAEKNLITNAALWNGTAILLLECVHFAFAICSFTFAPAALLSLVILSHLALSRN
jgi:hypothetical protein